MINMQIDLGLDNPDNRVEYELWYSSVFDLSSQQIKELAQYQSAFGNNTLFTPRIMTFECLNCPAMIREKNCLSDGKYCPYQPVLEEFAGVFSDKVIIMESLREKCIYNEIIGESYLDGDDVDYDIWFRYMLSMREVIDFYKALRPATAKRILL